MVRPHARCLVALLPRELLALGPAVRHLLAPRAVEQLLARLPALRALGYVPVYARVCGGVRVLETRACVSACVRVCAEWVG